MRSPGLLTRTGRNGEPVGYFEFDWKTTHGHGLRQIMIGPGKDEAEGRGIVGEVIVGSGLNLEVVRSIIPPVRA